MTEEYYQQVRKKAEKDSTWLDRHHEAEHTARIAASGLYGLARRLRVVYQTELADEIEAFTDVLDTAVAEMQQAVSEHINIEFDNSQRRSAEMLKGMMELAKHVHIDKKEDDAGSV